MQYHVNNFALGLVAYNKDFQLEHLDAFRKVMKFPRGPLSPTFFVDHVAKPSKNKAPRLRGFASETILSVETMDVSYVTTDLCHGKSVAAQPLHNIQSSRN